MRISIPLKWSSAAAALVLLAGCSQSVAPAPKSFSLHGNTRMFLGRIPLVLTPGAMFKVNPAAGRRFKSFDSCPKSGDIEYISDFNNSVINIYASKLKGQAPCGQISGGGLLLPEGLFVNKNTRDLYVANTGGFDVLAYHRGATTPYITYTDPTGEYPADVTVANDGTVIASNAFQTVGVKKGSISTWRGTGSFVGNYPMQNDVQGEFVTVQRNRTIYFNDVDATTGAGLLWSGSCPRGVCGAFTSTGATTVYPGGLRSADGEDVVQLDQKATGGGAIITYETFPTGASCAIGGGNPDGMDINDTEHDIFYADAMNNVAGEIQYPTCVFVGIAPGNPGGLPVGAAVDRPAGL